MEGSALKRFFRSRSLLILLILFVISLAGCSGGTDDTPIEALGDSQTVTIAAVGDIFLSDEMIEQAKQPDGSYDFLPAFADVFSAVSDTDLTIGNFEGNFNGSPYGPSYGSYPDELANTLKNGGFDVLQTANSYSVYAGMTGLERTKNIIEGKGIAALGTYVDSQDREENEVRLFEVNGVRVAFIAFTKSLSGMTLPDDVTGCVNMLYLDYMTDYQEINEEGILSAINKAKQLNADIIIAGLHWGSENISGISESQNAIADLMFTNGVDVILGSHSHIVSTVERRSVTTADGERKDVVLAYSLGDFCEVESGECNLAPVLKIAFTKSPTGKITLSKLYYSTVAAVDLGADAPVRFMTLDVDSALTLYESNYYDRISTELYDRLSSKRESMQSELNITP